MKNTQSEMVFPSKRLSASGGQYSALLSLLIISRKCVRGLQRSLGTVDWNRVFWGGSFIVQTVFLLGTFLWMSHMRRVLGSLGLDVKSIAALMRSHDPAHAASLIIKRQPALLGLARGVVEGLTKESGRVVVLPEVNRVLFDVSAKQTFRFLFDHMLINHEEELLPGLSMKSLEKNWGSFVVDLGAFDGIIASNSYNFMELGWRGLLVEPTPTTFDILKKTVARFGDRVNLENVVVGSEGKPVTFFIYDNPTSNSMYNRDPRYAKPKSKVHIQMWRASKLLVKHKVPKDFGVLSIDVEGMETEVVEDILDAGYHPYYIIMEKITLGVKEYNMDQLVRNMRKRGYSKLAEIHLNVIFHVDS